MEFGQPPYDRADQDEDSGQERGQGQAWAADLFTSPALAVEPTERALADGIESDGGAVPSHLVSRRVERGCTGVTPDNLLTGSRNSPVHLPEVPALALVEAGSNDTVKPRRMPTPRGADTSPQPQRRVNSPVASTPGTDNDPQRWRAVDLIVTTASHAEVRVSGAARRCPADKVHLDRSTGVIGRNCLLRQYEHFHLHHLEVSFDRLVASSEAMDRLQAAIARPTDGNRVRRFQAAVWQMRDRGQRTVPASEFTTRVREGCSVDAVASTMVLRDGGRVNRRVTFISELTTIDAATLLAGDFGLTASFVRWLASVEGASQQNLATLFAHAVGSVGDLDLIRGATDLRDPRTKVFRARGVEVDNAIGVLIGRASRVDRQVRVRRPGSALRQFPGFDTISELAARQREPNVNAMNRRPRGPGGL